MTALDWLVVAVVAAVLESSLVANIVLCVLVLRAAQTVTANANLADAAAQRARGWAATTEAKASAL